MDRDARAVDNLVGSLGFMPLTLHTAYHLLGLPTACYLHPSTLLSLTTTTTAPFSHWLYSIPWHAACSLTTHTIPPAHLPHYPHLPHCTLIFACTRSVSRLAAWHARSAHTCRALAPSPTTAHSTRALRAMKLSTLLLHHHTHHHLLHT